MYLFKAKFHSVGHKWSKASIEFNMINLNYLLNYTLTINLTPKFYIFNLSFNVNSFKTHGFDLDNDQKESDLTKCSKAILKTRIPLSKLLIVFIDGIAR